MAVQTSDATEILHHLRGKFGAYAITSQETVDEVPTFSTPRAKVTEILRGLGWDTTVGVAGHGVIATWPAAKGGSARAFRADMDALPMTERNEHDFCSENPGAAHMCGHDGHMAMLLGLARLIAEAGETPPRPVKLIFQPSEGDPARASISSQC